ncbi:hypothetical protein B566_EDAN015515 [Ephemera danica]|nr:hypothetical protein B566_EDAN015515 [Ephemera danica]
MPVCCVVNCSNKPGRDTKFNYYRFPWKSYETERRERWIAAVRRERTDGSPWMPVKRSTIICSAHFVGGKKSDEMHSPSYVPTIFPDIYKRKGPSSSLAQARYERMKARKFVENKKDTSEHMEISPSATTSDFIHSQPAEASSSSEPMQMKTNVENGVAYKSNQVTVSTQTEITINPKLGAPVNPSIENYESKVDKPKTFDEFQFIKEQCKGFHGYESIRTGQQMVDITGVTIFIFAQLLNILPAPKNNDKFNNKDKLLIFLMKMKLGITYSAMAVFFSCARPTISRTFKHVLNILHRHRENFVFWPDKFTVMATLPNSFKDKYRNCRVILDCTEFRAQQPHDIHKRVYLFSHYKNTFTIKLLIGITPCGFICLVSDCCGGKTSDTQMTLNSTLLSKLESGDMVMADKGFPGIKTALGDEHVITVMPPFCHEGTLTADELDETYNIASVRIHVERAIQRLKNYNILNNIAVDTFPIIDKIVQVAAVLSNLGKPLIVDE